MKTRPPLPRAFFNRDPCVVAHALLGTYLLRATADGLIRGRIVEAEAYLAQADPASHAYRGRTRRNASMFGPPGHAYVYAIHSRWCLNVVTEPQGVPSAVLIRAVEPLDGLELMRRRRARRRGTAAGTLALRDLARGPARLCEAFAIDRELDGWDLTRGARLWLCAAPPARAEALAVVVGPRVGVTSAHDLPLRFCLADCPFVSR
jgi:DNA-3-methyladenine glycosylase